MLTEYDIRQQAGPKSSPTIQTYLWPFTLPSDFSSALHPSSSSSSGPQLEAAQAAQAAQEGRFSMASTSTSATMTARGMQRNPSPRPCKMPKLLPSPSPSLSAISTFEDSSWTNNTQPGPASPLSLSPPYSSSSSSESAETELLCPKKALKSKLPLLFDVPKAVSPLRPISTTRHHPNVPRSRVFTTREPETPKFDSLKFTAKRTKNTYQSSKHRDSFSASTRPLFTYPHQTTRTQNRSSSGTSVKSSLKASPQQNNLEAITSPPPPITPPAEPQIRITLRVSRHSIQGNAQTYTSGPKPLDTPPSKKNNKRSASEHSEASHNHGQDICSSPSPKRRNIATMHDSPASNPTDDFRTDSLEAKIQVQPLERVGVAGLRNLGNTCYSNAVIQVLLHTEMFRKYFLSTNFSWTKSDEDKVEIRRRKANAPYSVGMGSRMTTRRIARLEEQPKPETQDLEEKSNSDRLLCSEMRDLLDCLWYDDPQQPEPVSTKKRQRRTNTVVFSPHELACAVAKHIPTFGEKGVQQDAQEFLLCTLGQLQEELRQEPPPAEHDSALPETIVSSVFGGRSMQKTTCTNCGHVSSKTDPFLDLSINIPGQRSGRATSLEECLADYTAAEQISVEQTPFPAFTASGICVSCQTRAGLVRQTVIAQSPEVFCIHLKRFNWNGKRTKVNTHIRFPFQLHLSPYMDEVNSDHQLYELYSIIVHIGSGADSGHYTAYVKRDSGWWHLNDDRASQVSAEAVAQAKAYLLFYHRSQV